MGKPFKFPVRFFQLVELSVENDWLLNVFHIFDIEIIITNAQFFDAEISF